MSFVPASSIAPAVVTVAGTVAVSNFPASQAVTGPFLTDTQLRASAVPVSGPLTNAELRAADVIVDQGAGGTAWAVVQANGAQSFCWFGTAGAVAWPIEDAAIAPLPQMYLTYSQRLALHVWNGDSGDVLDQIAIAARFDPLPLYGGSNRPTT